MTGLTWEQIEAHRARTFRLLPELRVISPEGAIDFVDERGFVFFWPAKDVTMPSLWAAVAGDRLVPNAHDDPGHITWRWKDDLLGARKWYYAKVLRKRATLISLALSPHFYALSENYGEPEQDYLIQYQEGRMTWEAKTIYETLLKEGPLDTVSLRRAARMTSKASNYPFARALDTLQADFKILPVGVAAAGAWRYAFIYECVHRYYPDLPEAARAIRQAEARQELVRRYLAAVGAAQIRDLTRLFGWHPRDVQTAIAGLVQSGEVRQGLPIDNREGEWLVLGSLAN